MRPPRRRPDLADGRVGIIDIGSNSIRLVVYDGPRRIPSILFNEKVMAGLGKGMAATGALDPQAVERAFVALDRFQLVAEKIGVASLHTVATARGARCLQRRRFPGARGGHRARRHGAVG